MTLRKIVRIDEQLCDGCGLCVPSCAEGALQIIDGKAKLVSEIYCDGLGACLGDCPNGAISIEEREAQDFDEEAVKSHLKGQNEPKKVEPAPTLPCGCPGSAVKTFTRGTQVPQILTRPMCKEDTEQGIENKTNPKSSLSHWPVQLRLVPVGAPFLQDADLLVCADCVPFAVPDFHTRYLKDRSVLVGCPKLDDLEMYLEKLTQIIAVNQPRSITVLRMEVPCCAGLANAVVEARNAAGSDVPVEIHTIGIREGAKRETILPQPVCAQGGV